MAISIPVTHVPDAEKADGAPVVAPIAPANPPLPVAVTTGSVAIEVNLAGTAVSSPKTPSSLAILVQHVDDTGTPLRQGTQDAILSVGTSGNAVASLILNSQGTHATSALQNVGNASLALVVNNQGTQATSALQSAGNTLLTVVHNSQGTQSTSALQSAANTTLTAILGAVRTAGYPRSIDRGSTAFVTKNDTQLYAILGVRTAAAGTIVPTSASIICSTNAIIQYQLVVNPTITGAVVWTALPNSGAEYANQTVSTGTASVITNGTVVYSDYAAAGQAVQSVKPIGLSVPLGSDQLWLCARRITGTTESVFGSIQFLST